MIAHNNNILVTTTEFTMVIITIIDAMALFFINYIHTTNDSVQTMTKTVWKSIQHFYTDLNAVNVTMIADEI